MRSQPFLARIVSLIMKRIRIQYHKVAECGTNMRNWCLSFWFLQNVPCQVYTGKLGICWGRAFSIQVFAYSGARESSDNVNVVKGKWCEWEGCKLGEQMKAYDFLWWPLKEAAESQSALLSSVNTKYCTKCRKIFTCLVMINRNV